MKKKLKLKKEIKGSLSMLLVTFLTVAAIYTTAADIATIVVYFTYNFIICLLILTIVHDKK